MTATNLNKWKVNYEYGEIDNDNIYHPTRNNGNIAKQTISFDGLAAPFVQNYKYDALNRLKEATEKSGTTTIWQQTFGYDRYGNRTSFSQTGGPPPLPQPTIDSTTNRFVLGQGYAYDFNGNVIVDSTNGGRQFTFNGDNKQTLVKDANNQTIGQYFYDSEGKRVKKVTATETTIFVYSGSKLIAEYSTQAPPTTPTTNYVMTDVLQSVRAISDASGQVTSRRDFMPFGEELLPDATYRTTTLKYGSPDDKIRQKFTGYQKDEETQLDFAEARMYQNKHGRFTAVDPLLASGKSANPQTFNRYVYVMNSPLILSDPSGMQAGWAIDFRDTSPTGEKTPWVYFRYFENPEFRDTSNAVNGTNFQPFSGQYYVYGDNQRSFAYLSSSGRYFEGRISTHIDIEEIRSLQEAGKTEEVDNKVRNAIVEQRASLLGSQDASVTADPQREMVDQILFSRIPGMQSLPARNMPSIANEFRMQRKHFEGTLEANRVLKNDGAAHLFNDIKTYNAVESQLFKNGTFTGITNQGSRSWARFGLRFNNPVGFRLSQNGTRTPLSYGELKLDLNTNFYHIIPRTGPR